MLILHYTEIQTVFRGFMNVNNGHLSNHMSLNNVSFASAMLLIVLLGMHSILVGGNVSFSHFVFYIFCKVVSLVTETQYLIDTSDSRFLILKDGFLFRKPYNQAFPAVELSLLKLCFILFCKI